jgi:hypothetical protein
MLTIEFNLRRSPPILALSNPVARLLVIRHRQLVWKVWAFDKDDWKLDGPEDRVADKIDLHLRFLGLL